MATIKSFKALRPAEKLAEKIASKPYDVLNSKEARKEAKGNEYSFLRINKSEIDLPEDIDHYSKEVYEKGKENLDLFTKNGWLQKEEKDCMYIYGQKMGNHEQKGLVACSSIDDYFNDVIKKHEYTRPKKENDRIEHTKTLRANVGPVFLTYKPLNELDEIIENWATENDPVYDFTAEDNITHTVWIINDDKTIENIESIFAEKVEQTYVADGHHRSAAAAKVGELMRKENPDYSGEEDFNYFLSVLFPSNQLKIIDYNRVVRNLLPDISTEEMLTALLANFSVLPTANQFHPTDKGEFGMYIDGRWYRLKADEDLFEKTDVVEGLDISILSNYVIDPLLGIENQRTDDRIDFVGGIRGLDELERRVDSGEMRLAFAIPPVSIEQLIAVADSGKVMPPKSTWFEPKLRSGLLIHTF